MRCRTLRNTLQTRLHSAVHPEILHAEIFMRGGSFHEVPSVHLLEIRCLESNLNGGGGVVTGAHESMIERI